MLRSGDLVEVRSREEILATLDASGCIERMPFMPEMLQYCGRQFRVSAIAHKTCDSAYKTGGRRLKDAVHLEDLRCNGAAHGGCQATCLLFWKTAWLKPVESRVASRPSDRTGITEEQLLAATVKMGTQSPEPLYVCQATQLYHATELLPWWDFTQFWRDLRYRNTTFRRAVRVLTVAFFRSLLRLPAGHRVWAGLYDAVHRRLNGFPAPSGTGVIPLGKPTPGQNEGLREGDLVTVRDHEDIKRTLNAGSKNRGMWFDHEMVKFCGKQYEVAGRVDHIIDEVSGKMLHMKQPCIVLKGVHCTAEYTDGRLLCRRAVTTYWRENWLQRTSEAASTDSQRRAG